MRRIGDRRGASRSGKAGVHEGCLDRGADAAFLESLTPEPGKTLCAICVGVARISARAWSPRRLGTAGSGRVAATAYLDTHGSIVDVRLTAHDEGGGVLGAWRCAPSPQRRTLLSESKSAPARRGSVQTTTRRRALWTLDAGSHRARGGAPPGTLDPAMPPKKKGNGEDEAEACPADMDPEVWAVVKDVNQLVALASKKTSAPPVTRFDALLHLWSAAASNPRERDALVAAGALAASLAASKPDVPFLDRGAGLGLTRALTVGDERTSVSSAAHLEAASEARVAASALEALLRGSSTSTRCVADALAILLGLARHASTRQRTIATIAASGARAWIALADALTLDERHETVAAADASRDAASLMSLCARFGDAGADADAAAVDAAGSAIASVLATRTNALEHLLDAVCGAESELQSLKKKREDGDEDEDDEDERSVTYRGAEPPRTAHLSALALERSRSIQLRRADKRLAAAECLALCSRSDDAGDWLFRGFQTPRVARLVRFMRRGHFVLQNVLQNPTSENLSDDAQRRFVTEVIEEEPFRNAAATALFNAVDRGACARADLALRRALAEDAALRAEAVSEEAEETDGEKNKKKPKPISNPPLDLRREKLPGGFGQAARRSLADRRSATADGGPITHTGADASGADSRIVASRSGVAKMERARALCDVGGVAPLVALLLEKEKPKKGREGVTDGQTRSSSEKEKKSPEEKRREALKQALTLEGRRSAAGLTRYLTALDARTTSLVIAAGGVRAAVAALADADDDTRRHAQAALWNVANVEMEETNDAGDGGDGEEAEAKKKTAVPRAHAEALRDANAPGYVSKVMAYGDQLEKLALRDASDNRCPDRPDASK